MPIRRPALVLASLLWLLVAQGARAQDEPAPPNCPVLDSLGESGVRHFDFPPLETSIYAAEYLARDGTRHPGKEGVDDIVDVVIRSHHTGCTPITLMLVVGGSDFDSRGKQFEDHVSIERVWRSGKEIKDAVEAARVQALAQGPIANIPVRVTGGGIGTRHPNVATPTTEPERRQNRWLSVRLLQVLSRSLETEGATLSASPPLDLLP